MKKGRINKQTAYILLTVALSSVLMNYVDAILQPGYAVKSAVKLVLFSAVVLVYFIWNRLDAPAFGRLLLPARGVVFFSLGAGILIAAVIIGGYFALRDVLDLSAVTANLTQAGGITAENFLFVAIYISFCNSLLEEFFFRGFGFCILRQHFGRIPAYIFSSFFFAFYHVGMTLGWVALPLFLLELCGLMAAGAFFNFIDEKTDSLLPSYVLHMFCNFGINTVGCILFGIL